MKKYIAILAAIIGAYTYGQQIPTDLKLAVKMDKRFASDSLSGQDFSYYSKNYDKIFGPSLFTEDYLNYSRNAIYINPDNKVFYNDAHRVPHIFTVMPLAGVNVDAFFACPQHAIYDVESR